MVNTTQEDMAGEDQTVGVMIRKAEALSRVAQDETEKTGRSSSAESEVEQRWVHVNGELVVSAAGKAG